MDVCTKYKPLEAACIRQTRKEVNPAVLRRSAMCFWCLCSWRECWGHQEDPCCCDISGTCQEEENKVSCSWYCLGGPSATNLLALQLDRCKSYTSRSSLVLPKQGGVFSELEFIIMPAQIKTKLCFPFLKAHCRPLSLSLQFYSKGIPVTLGNFLVSSQSQTVNAANLHMKGTSTDVRCHIKNGYSYIFGLGWYFLLLSSQKWADTVLTLVTRHHRNMPRVSLCIHSLAGGAPFCLNAKKPWKNIHTHKDSIWRGKRDVQELLSWFLFLKEPGASLKA